MDFDPYVDDEPVIDEFQAVDSLDAPSVTATPAPVTATPTPLSTRSALDPITAPTSGGTAWYDLFDSDKITGLVKSSDIMAAQEKRLADLERGVTGENDDAEEFDGPPKTGSQLGDLARSLGLPTSFATIVDDVQDALVGTIQDLTNTAPPPPLSKTTSIDVTPNLSEAPPEKKSFAEIVFRGNRLRGWGVLFIVCALVGIMVAALLMPSM